MVTPPPWAGPAPSLYPSAKLEAQCANMQLFCVASKSRIKQFAPQKALLGLCFWKYFSLFIFKLCSFEKEIKAGKF